ncbi:hypothetical protein GE21DRAFT_1214940 [Neurospora crassa]|nr:hypothetical protein GE21DRAFT_1214940 [Neurospora crassa]
MSDSAIQHFDNLKPEPDQAKTINSPFLSLWGFLATSRQQMWKCGTPASTVKKIHP